MKRPRSASRGYSLIELLIVLGIIVLLLAVFLPAVSRVRESSRSTACLANLQQWGQSYQMYLGSGWEMSCFACGF